MINYFLIGIKGTGLSSLALILKEMGSHVFGIDKDTYFFTQEKLLEKKIKIYTDFNFNFENVIIDVVIYSTAYENTLLVNEMKKKYDTYSYIDYLSYLTKNTKAYGISGTHGKTTTAAATSFALSYKNRKNFPFFSIYGSSLIDNDSLTYQGDKALVIEACEYENHFLSYELNGAIITSIDFDHPDFFDNEKDVIESFIKFSINIKKNGFLILNFDDRNVKSIIPYIKKARDDLNIITYGFYDNSIFRIQKDNLTQQYKIRLTCDDLFNLKYNDRALVSDIVSSAILSTCILLDRDKVDLYLNEEDIICDEVFTTLFRISLKSLEHFSGVRGRLELKKTYNNVVFIDDYAHHPKEIYTLLNEIKARYPNRKIIAAFSFHTASRTKALYKDFLNVLLLFDKLIITKTFMSARMDKDRDNLDKKMVKDLNSKLLKSYKVKLASAIYVEDDIQLASICASMIEDGDIFLSLGASNNDELYKDVIRELKRR